MFRGVHKRTNENNPEAFNITDKELLVIIDKELLVIIDKELLVIDKELLVIDKGLLIVSAKSQSSLLDLIKQKFYMLLKFKLLCSWLTQYTRCYPKVSGLVP